MTLQQQLEQLETLDKKISSLSYAIALVSWDAQTLAPKEGVKARSTALEGLYTYYFNTLICPETETLLTQLEKALSQSQKTSGEEVQPKITQVQQAKLAYYRDEYNKIGKVPADEYAAYQGLCSESQEVWEKAKETDDFKLFAPYLEKVITYNRNYIKYQNKGGHPYDTLLNDYENGLTVEIADTFFDYLRKELVPLLSQIKNSTKTISQDFLHQKFDPVNQAKFAKFLMEKLNFRMDCGVIAESMHPFTLNLSRDDVRITTNYHEEDLMSAIFSTIHETGHAIYEQNVSIDLGLSAIASGTTMGIHESQSRIYENNFGRSKEFWNTLYSELVNTFKEQLSEVTFEAFYEAINVVKPSLIRIEADELTYALHIMVRYEIEKMIFENKVEVNDLPQLWRSKYQEYLGVSSDDDVHGVLQDVHWSNGLFGYFPSYALGSAYAAQFQNKMNQVLDIPTLLSTGNLLPIREWLTENIHQYGKTRKPDEIILQATGEPFNPKYYVDYLKKKYSEIYALNV